MAIAYTKPGRGLIKVNGSTIELIRPEGLRLNGSTIDLLVSVVFNQLSQLFPLKMHRQPSMDIAKIFV